MTLTKLPAFSFVQPITDTDLVPTVPPSEAAYRGYLQEPSNELADLYADYIRAIVNEMMDDIPKHATDTGTANTYVIAPSPAYTTLADLTGVILSFKAVNANTGASTLKVNAITAAPFIREDGSALQANDILANEMVNAQCDGTSFRKIGTRTKGKALQTVGTAASVTDENIYHAYASNPLWQSTLTGGTYYSHGNFQQELVLSKQSLVVIIESHSHNGTFSDNIFTRLNIKQGGSSVATSQEVGGYISSAGTLVPFTVNFAYVLNAGTYNIVPETKATSSTGGNLNGGYQSMTVLVFPLA